MSIDINVYNNNYTLEKINRQISNYNKLLSDVNFYDYRFKSKLLILDDKVVNRIRHLRDTYCKYNSKKHVCDKKEIGGELVVNNNNKVDSIYQLFYGNGDNINLKPSLKNSILFHTHPNAFGIWNKASPPSEFDLQHMLELSVQGNNRINLIWDRYGVYIYYIYPNVAKKLLRYKSILMNREGLIDIFRYLKMGFGFYFNNRDYPGHYNIKEPSSFSKYRNILKQLGIYVDFKPYNKEISFYIPE